MFIDWNHNNRIDPVDIGISIAAFGEEIDEAEEVEVDKTTGPVHLLDRNARKRIKKKQAPPR